MHKLFPSLKQLLSSTINSALPGGDYDVKEGFRGQWSSILNEQAQPAQSKKEKEKKAELDKKKKEKNKKRKTKRKKNPTG